MIRKMRLPIIQGLIGNYLINKVICRSQVHINRKLKEKFFHSSSILFDRIPFKLADIGEGITEVEILKWYIKVGDSVRQFDKICEVQSDKATVDITSRYDGIVEVLNWKVGEMAKVGSSLLELQVDEVTEPQEEKPDNTCQVKNHNLDHQFQVLEKRLSHEVHIEKPPQILENLGSYTVDPTIVSHLEPLNQPIEELKNDETSRIIATPSIRRLARDHKLDLSHIPSTGKNGRILKEDVLKYLADVPIEKRKLIPPQEYGSEKKNESSSTSTSEILNKNDTIEEILKDYVVPVTGLTRVMMKSMEQSVKIPHFNFMEEYEVNNLVNLQKNLRKIYTEKKISITYMPLIIKAISLALKKFPNLNAHFNSQTMEMTYKASHNIGVAMDTNRGLLVPVIKDCQQKTIFDINKELNLLKELGASNKLGPEELSNATFTISNIGVIGGTYASPIIPSPTVLIGAIGRIRTLVKFNNEENPNEGCHSCQVLNISFAADHRVVDGATVARFSNQLKSYLENPVFMLSDLK